MRPLTIVCTMMTCIAMMIFQSCEKSEDTDTIKLSNNYSGFIKVVYERGFPQFSCMAKLDVEIWKDGTVVVTGSGDSDTFDAEDVYYEDGKPVTKVKMSGTLMFYGAQGEVMVDGDNEYALIEVSSSIDGQMTVWAWDDEMGWIQVLDTPYTYEDKYSDGPFQFNILYAIIGDGHSISQTLPDLQGTFTYGYTLWLIAL